MKPRIVFLTGVIVLAFFAVIIPNNSALENIPEVPALLNEAAADLSGVKIDSGEVAKRAMLQSLDIRVFELGDQSKRTELMREKSKYDTRFKALTRYEQVNEQQPSIVMGDRTITGSVDLSLSKKTALGTEAEIFHNNQRNSTNSAFSSLSRNYESHAGITLRQPLLKNSFGYIDRGEVKLVKLDIQGFELGTLDKIEKHVFESRKNYWDLVKAVGFVEARKKGLKLAQEFLEITQNQIETGQSEEQDLYAARANVNARIRDLLEGHLQAKLSMNRLKLTLSTLEDFLPTEKPLNDSVQLDLETLVTQSLSSRRDFKAKQLELEAKGIQLKINKLARLPEMDAFGTYGNNALDRDQYNTQGEIWGFNHPTYILGFEFSFPLENRQARADAKKAKYEKEKVMLEIKQLEQKIELEIQDIYKEVLVKQEVVGQTREIFELNQKKLEAEMKQFKSGRSSSKTVIDYQNDLVQAEWEAVQAASDFEVVKDKLLLVQNRLLESLDLIQKENKP